MIEPGLYQYLSQNAEVTALVSGRIYPVTGPTDNPTYPYIAYRDISGGHDDALDASEASHKTIQFDIFADPTTGFLVGKYVIQALRNALVGYSGILPDGTRILSTHRGNEQDNFDFDQRVYHSFAEYDFEYVEP